MTDPGSAKLLRGEVAALLGWYAGAGIDAILEDAPRDRFAETTAEGAARRPRQAAGPADGAAPAPSPEPRREAAPTPQPSAPTLQRTVVPDDIAIADARARARGAGDLGTLEAALASFEGCNLRLSAKSLVFGAGAGDARLMMIGEAPERDEDMTGVPFSGRSGALLDRMLASIGLERGAVRLTTAVPWRPPGNRQPTPAETEICLPFLARHIELVRPAAIVCLGSLAARALLRSDDSILRLRGRWRTYSFGLSAGESVPVLPMLHPTYLLKHPAQKRLAWQDLLLLREKLSNEA